MKLFTVAALLTTGSALAQLSTEPPAGLYESQPDYFAITGARAWIDVNTQLDNATLVLRDGRIVSVKQNDKVPNGATEIKANGKWLLPGFIDAAGSYGLDPDKACRGANSESPGAPAQSPQVNTAKNWNASVCPERDLSQDLKLDSKLAKKLNGMGFTASITVPALGVWRGQAAALLIRPDSTANDAVYKAKLLQIGAMQRNQAMSAVSSYPASTMGAIALIRQSLYDARWQAQTASFKQANVALDALAPVALGRAPVLIDTTDELEIARANKLAREFGLDLHLLGNGYEYRVLADLPNVPLILPLNFPDTPPVRTSEDALEVPLAVLEHWQLAPSNPARVAKLGRPFALTARGLMKPEQQFLKNLRLAISKGLSIDQAIAALSIVPAQISGVPELSGLRSGNIANLLIVSDNWLNSEQGKLFEVWTAGHREVLKPLQQIGFAGRYQWQLPGTGAPKEFVISDTPSLSVKAGEKKLVASQIEDRLQLYVPGSWLGAIERDIPFTISKNGDTLKAFASTDNGLNLSWQAERLGEAKSDADKSSEATKAEDKSQSADIEIDTVRYPAGEFGRVGMPASANVVFRNATVWMPNADLSVASLPDTDVWIKDGVIRAVGKALNVDQNTVEVDAKGKHLSPGIIDAHSHIAVEGDVNEGTHTVTSEVRIGDVLDPTDINIYRQLAGGVTTAHLLHGSANAIGGQSQVIKLRWGAGAEALKFAEAAPTIKFALGENPKQANWGDAFVTRYPQTRMGVEQLIADSFAQAKRYAGDNSNNKRRDLRLEGVAEILAGKRMIHAHSYRQDEILMLARMTQQLGIKIAAFQHVLEGYKVADVLADVNAGASTFADWWAFKAEVFDAIPYNAAMMTRANVVTSLNSDSPDNARRLNTEAAKTIRFGGLSEAQALALITLNPAKQLKVDAYVGTVSAGKQADLVLWSAPPLSARARVLQTWIDGRKYFDREQDQAERARIASAREALIAKARLLQVKALAEAPSSSGDAAGKANEKKPNHVHGHLHQHLDWGIFAGDRKPYHNGEPANICLSEDH